MIRPIFSIILSLSICSLARAQGAIPALPLTVPDGIGVNIHFTDPQPGEMKMIADAGFKWIRMDFAWNGTEREKGIYDFGAYDRLLQALDEYSIRPIFILDYSNRFFDSDLSPHSPEGIAAFAKWAAAAVTHFKGRPIVWEMYNEPNGGFWKPHADVHAYATLALATGKAIHGADPSATYVGPATSTIDFPYLEACFKAGCLQDWSAVSVHPYRQSSPETAGSEYQHLRELIAKYAPAGKQIPILSGEWGYSSVWVHFDDDRQGKYLSRELLTNLANSIPISIWYDWRDDGNDPREPEHHFGTAHEHFQPNHNPPYDLKPAYRAAATLTHQLQRLHLLKRIATESEDDYLLLFGDTSRLVLVAWTADKPAHSVIVPTSSDLFIRVSHLGEPLPPLKAEDSAARLDLTDSPQFLRCQRADDTKLLAAPARKPAPISVGITAEGETCHIAVTELSDAPFKGRFELVDSDPAIPGPVPAQFVQADGGTRVLHFDTRFPARPDGRRSLTLRLINNDGSLFYQMPRITFAPLPFDVDPDRPSMLPVTAQPDGDPKVASEQTLSVAPPEPLAPTTGPIIRLTYRFDAAWKFVRLAPRTDVPEKLSAGPIALGLWIRQSSGNAVLRMRFTDLTGQTFQPDGTSSSLIGNDWAFVRFPLTAANAGHWGGANDGVVHPPIKLDTLLLIDNGTREATSGQVDLAGPTLFYDK